MEETKTINIDVAQIGDRLRKARIDAGLTQYQLHLLVDISVSQISAYENGCRSIGLHSLWKISNALGKTMDEIYCGSKETRPISVASNDGELIVNCMAALIDKGIISYLAKRKSNDFVPMGCEFYYKMGFNKYLPLLDEFARELVGFNKNKDNYPDPDNFRNQILAATARKTNSGDDF